MRAVLLAVCGMVSLNGWAGAQPYTFEVASIKPDTVTMNGNMSINYRPGGMMECTNVTLAMLVNMAYDVRDYQVTNLPTWATTDHWDIVAKPPAEEAAKESAGYTPEKGERMRERTRGLLADRFGLVLHKDSKEMPVYALVVAKGGAKLTPTEKKLDVGSSISINDRSIKCRQVTMQRFADVILANRMGRRVMDKTGLTGEYDLSFEFVPDPPAPKPGEAPADPGGPTFFMAMQEKLGLKIESAKGPVEFLIIDKVSKPSEN